MTEEIIKGMEYGMLSSVTLIPSEGGVFEVTVNGQLVHSRNETGTFPQPGAVLAKIKERSPAE
ncbi:MAG: Rdx family protein [Chloroflexi bacterium]|nr:Rdx family protein [Chloroflexota bacterium]